VEAKRVQREKIAANFDPEKEAAKLAKIDAHMEKMRGLRTWKNARGKMLSQ
jgi:hypothetical protein